MRPRRVRTRAELAEFIDLAPRLARARGEGEHYVPLFAADIREWFAGSDGPDGLGQRAGRGQPGHRNRPGGHRWFDEPVELWLFDDGAGDAVARLMCHRSGALAAKLESDEACPPPLFFGAVEAADPEALTAVIAFLFERAEQVGAPRIFGPVSPLPNVTGGLLTEGEANPGFFDSAWNPAFWWPVFADAGFTSWGPAHTWEVPIGSIPAPRATAVTAAEWHARGLRRRRVSRLGLGRFARRLLPSLNAAFSALPYYTDISPAQLRSQMQGLSALMDPDLIIDIAGADDADEAPPRCFALVIPDPVPILRRHGGRLGVRAVLDLARHRRTIRDAVLIIQGTDPRFQGAGLLSLVNRELNSALVANGYRRLRVTFIAEDNPASAAVFARSGGRQMHRLVFVDRDVASSGAPGPVDASPLTGEEGR